MKSCLLSLLLLFVLKDNGVVGNLRDRMAERRTRNAERKAQMERMQRLRMQNADYVSNTKEAAELRSYELRRKKKRGLLRREKSLAQILFPGASPELYAKNDEMTMFVEQVESKKTQVPFNYYKLPVCKRPQASSRKRIRKNLGQRLTGSSVQPVPYAIRAGQDMGCTPICAVSIGAKPVRWLRKLISDQYRVHFSLDSLPVLMRSRELNYAVRGFPLGFMAPPSNAHDKSEIYLFNHLKFTISYHQDRSPEGMHIVGFDVHPVSIAHQIPKNFDALQSQPEIPIPTCNHPAAEPVINNPETYLPLRTSASGEDMRILYSYEVEWVPTEVTWSDRWDIYLIGAPDDNIHYFAIVNSLMMVLLLTGAVATILIRTLRKDIASYNEMDDGSEEETGWKLLHGDVFRPPQQGRTLLSVAVGTGMQIASSVFLTMICAVLKMLNPMRKGQTLTSVVVLYVLMGSVAGYVSSRLYKYFDGAGWKRATMLTATAFPALLVTMFIFLNLFLSIAGASTAVSFLTIIFIFFLWVCVSSPLVFVGSYFGYRADKLEVPTRTNHIARFIPEQPFYTTLPWSALLGGLLPFGSVSIELYFIMGALWLHQIYYVMGFVLAVLLILTITCAMVAMVMCYVQLCGENHQWWWKSFYNCASAGLYLFVFSLWYLLKRLDLVGVLPVMVYLTYMSMISISFALYCGSVGFLSCFWLNRKIYGAVKVD